MKGAIDNKSALVRRSIALFDVTKNVMYNRIPTATYMN